MLEFSKSGDNVNPDSDSTNDSAVVKELLSFDMPFDDNANAVLLEHKAWLKNIKRETPLPKHNYKVAVYIRYYNQTKHKNYLDYHKKQYLDTLALCPNWDFVGFYVDEGAVAPNMENAKEWSKLLSDCYEGKVNLIITQKASNVSKNLSELTFCARILAALDSPVGIYFVSEDIFTLASYYQEDLRDDYFLPTAQGKELSDGGVNE